jgi:hypothetical protein
MSKDRILVVMMQTPFCKYTICFSSSLESFYSHPFFIVYFNVVKRETKTTQLLDDNKLQQDMTFLKELGKKSPSLTEYSLYMW